MASTHRSSGNRRARVLDSSDESSDVEEEVENVPLPPRRPEGVHTRRGAAANPSNVLIVPTEAEREAPAFDEDPAEVGGDEEATMCRKMMELIEEHQEALGSKLYVDLANFTGELSKIERRAKRMRTRLIQYDGSDCSVLIPSEVLDNAIADDDFGESELSEDPDAHSESDGGDGSSSCCSTLEEHVGDEIVDSKLTTRVGKHRSSDYYMCYMGKHYSVPRRNILRNYERPIECRDHAEYLCRQSRSHRSRAWRWEPIPPASIVVVKMWLRNNVEDNVWCVTLKRPLMPADKVVVPLPRSIVLRLYRTMEADSALTGSSLLTTYQPTYALVDEPEYHLPPIPGPSRIAMDFEELACATHNGSNGTERPRHSMDDMTSQERSRNYVAGNWWTRVDDVNAPLEMSC